MILCFISSICLGFKQDGVLSKIIYENLNTRHVLDNRFTNKSQAKSDSRPLFLIAPDACDKDSRIYALRYGTEANVTLLLNTAI